MADDQQLSTQDVSDLQEIRKRMDPNDGRGAKIDTLLQNSARPEQIQGAYQSKPKGPIQNANTPPPPPQPSFVDRAMKSAGFTKQSDVDPNYDPVKEGEQPFIGAAKGAGSTAYSLANLTNKALRYTGGKLGLQDATDKYIPAFPEQKPEELTTNTTGQKIGYAAEQGAEFALPGGVIGKGAKAIDAGVDAARLAPLAAKALKLTGRAALEGASGAGVGAVQGLDPKVAGLASAATPLAAAALRPIGAGLKEAFAPAIAPAEATATRAAAEFQPALRVTPQEVLQHAAQNGIELTPAQATRSKLQQGIQYLGERSVLGGKGLEDALEKNHAAFANSVEDFGRRVDPQVTGTSAESTGETLQQSAKAAKDVAHENASNGYKQIDYLMPEKVDGAPISARWNDLRESLPMGVEKSIIDQVPRSMKAVTEDLLSGNPDGFKPTFEQGVKLRSFFRELGETEGLPNSQQGIFRQMSNAVDSTMESTASKLGAAQQWRDANAGWKDYTTKYGDPKSPLSKILREPDPKKISDALLTRQSANDIDILKKEGMSLDPLKRQVIDRITKNGFSVKQGGLGGFSDAFLNTLFKPDEIKELYVKSEIGRRINFNPNPSGTGGIHVAESQITDPKQLLSVAGAARMSLPRNALSYLENQKRLPQGFMQAVMAGLRGNQAADQ